MNTSIVASRHCVAELAVSADDPAMIANARRLCRETFTRWGLDPGHSSVDSATVIVSELVTNVHLHARHLSPVAEITLRWNGAGLTIEVHDRHPGQPHIPRSPATDEPHGRGLFLVRELATAAGGGLTVVMDPDNLGKTLRVELPVSKRPR